MKSIRKLLVGAAYVGTLIAPLALSAVAHAAEQTVVSCATNNEIVLVPDERQICDLTIDKLVSVNGGAFVEADTSADAAQAHVGDTITWKIVLTNTSSEGLVPHGIVYINDILPSGGVTYVSSSATVGNYITSGFFANDWYVPLLQSDGGDGFVTSLPATLTITSTSSSVGLFQNTATLVKYDPGFCDGGCTYVDGDPTNDSNDAWIDPSAKPVVLAETTTLVNTGSGTTESIVAGGLIIATLAVAFLGRNSRGYKINR